MIVWIFSIAFMSGAGYMHMVHRGDKSAAIVPLASGVACALLYYFAV